MGPRNVYLFLYNAALCSGWSYCLYLTIITVAAGGGPADVYKAVEVPLKISQTAALMEVLHSAIRLVRSPVMITAMQVASRIWLLWGIIVPVNGPTTTGKLEILRIGQFDFSLSIITLMTAWCLSEIIRYSFFALKELGLSPYFSLWLRYTAFIPLYPLGVGSELAMVWLALPTIKATGLWSVQLPNRFNFGFDYHTACIVGMLTYLPGFPQLYGYMLVQRKKNLSPAKAKTQ